MTQHTTSQLTWYHKPFGQRVVSPEHPYFFILRHGHPEDGDARRRQDLAGIAGL